MRLIVWSVVRERETGRRAILRVEQNGAETCELSPNSNFVRIQVPLGVLGEGPEGKATFHYDLGAFSSREIPVTMEPDRRIDLRFRLPKELFRSRERLILEVFQLDHEGAKNVLWSTRYEVGWRGEDPYLEPVAD
jgi:hypothetical protein